MAKLFETARLAREVRALQRENERMLGRMQELERELAYERRASQIARQWQNLWRYDGRDQTPMGE